MHAPSIVLLILQIITSLTGFPKYRRLILSRQCSSERLDYGTQWSRDPTPPDLRTRQSMQNQSRIETKSHLAVHLARGRPVPVGIQQDERQQEPNHGDALPWTISPSIIVTGMNEPHAKVNSKLNKTRNIARNLIIMPSANGYGTRRHNRNNRLENNDH